MNNMSSTEQGDFFDVERFIDIIQARTSLWDFRCPNYTNKFKKQECWQEVCREMTVNFDNLPKDKQTEIGIELQKKWKGIRSSFARELQKRKQTKSESAASRKTYIYFDQLSFLLPVCALRKTSTNMEHDLDQDENPELQDLKPPTNKNNKKRRNKQFLSVPDESTDQLCKIVNESLEHQTVAESTDSATVIKSSSSDDKLFLLSLHSDLKNIPANMKFDAKMEMISVLKKYTNLHTNNL